MGEVAMGVSSTSMYEQLRPVIRAEHVAVIGASSTEGKAGNRLLQHLKLHGYEGRISPVNPSGGEIDGLTCYPAVGDIPETVDCAIVLTPLGASVEAVRACADAGVRSCVLGGVGFAELGTDEGRTRQAQSSTSPIPAACGCLAPIPMASSIAILDSRWVTTPRMASRSPRA